MVIEPGLVYLTRSDWGAVGARVGYPVARTARTEIWVHHTVVIDDDATPNLWESQAEVKAKMRQLQQLRPDLSPAGQPSDVPYNLVIFLMADGTIVVCEGRGLDLTGAHTYGHNTKGIGVALEGNFQLPTVLVRFLPKISRVLGWLKFDNGMVNLASIGGHKDVSATSCPGYHLYVQLPKLTFKEDVMFDEAAKAYLRGLVRMQTRMILTGEIEPGLNPGNEDPHWPKADEASRGLRLTKADVEAIVADAGGGAGLSGEQFAAIVEGIVNRIKLLVVD